MIAKQKDEYSKLMLQRERKDKVDIKFIGEREYLYSGWEINQITSHLNNFYYKNELVNTLKSRINMGVKPENIIIMNESIKLNLAYTKYEEGSLNLNDDSELLNFYFLGSPITLYPNAKIYKMNILFEMVRDLFSSTNQTKVNSINRKELLNLLINKQQLIPNGIALKELVKKMLIDCNQDNLKKDSALLNDINKKIDKLEKYYLEWDNLNKEDTSTDVELNSKFEYIFKRYEKPILCVFNEDSNSIDILCIDMIAMKYFKENNARLLETREIKQNSPLMISIGIAVGFLPSLVKLGESLINANKAKKDYKETIKELEEETSKVEKELEDTEKELKKNKETLESIDKVTTVNVSKHSIESIVAIEIIDGINSEIRNNFVSLLEKKKVSIEGIEKFK